MPHVDRTHRTIVNDDPNAVEWIPLIHPVADLLHKTSRALIFSTLSADFLSDRRGRLSICRQFTSFATHAVPAPPFETKPAVASPACECLVLPHGSDNVSHGPFLIITRLGGPE